MATRRPRWHRIKLHRNYTVDEAACTLGVAKGTVRRWIKNGLPCINDRKPALILGKDLKEFGQARTKSKVKCKPHEFYCFKCRCPMTAALDMADYAPLSPRHGNLTAICSGCETIMNKRVATIGLPALCTVLTISFSRASEHLEDSVTPSPNDNLKKDQQR